MARFTHIAWDWNGTLLDDLDLCIELVNDVLTQSGHNPVDREGHRNLFDFPVEAYYRRLGIDLSGDRFKQLSDRFIFAYEARRHECRVFPGAANLVRELKNAGTSQLVLSAYKQESLASAINQFGFSGHFDWLVGQNNTLGRGKQDRARQWVRSFDVNPRSLLVIGDTIHDFEVARSIGAHCWLLASGHHSHERLSTCGVPVYDNVSELREQLL